jgi:excisionase family DNA binding protein
MPFERVHAKVRGLAMDDILTVAEAAAYMRLSKAQLYKMITRHQVPHIRLGQKRVVIRRIDLEKWLEGNTQKAPTDPKVLS